jgi:hypothetical protein|tara:strand:+ start:2217 stop:2882 length:666 start_codon:yes stop_codon:yes gene_type:complete
MALNKLKFNSINVTPSASEALKFNSSANGFETGSAGGAMTIIKKLTASSSGGLSFVDGTSNVVLDNTYKEYIFLLNNIHPSSDSDVQLQFNGSADTGSNYNVTKTTSHFSAYHYESDAHSPALGYNTSYDIAQGTGFQVLSTNIGADNDQCGAGYLHLFNPSSTTFVKHFIANISFSQSDDVQRADYTAGYFNTTSAIDAIQFKFSSGNIDAGTITLYGIN